MKYKVFIILSPFLLHLSIQNCPEEISKKGIQVTWHESEPGNNIVSEPMCYYENSLLTRQCNGTDWSPPLEDLNTCMKVVQHFDLSSCPPTFNKISEESYDHCFQINDPSAWNYPCLKNGGASIITELSDVEIEELVKSLARTNSSRYFWLPAQRTKILSPLVWTIPGPNWGRTVSLGLEKLRSSFSWFKNCLLLDVEQLLITTETCDKEYPSLCFYVNDLHYPSKCPKNYYEFRFMPNDGKCFGIEHADETQLTFKEFVDSKCESPMGDYRSEYSEIKRFIFKKVAEINNMLDDSWCWFGLSVNYNFSATESEMIFPALQGIVNRNGTLGLIDKQAKLPCIACEREMAFTETVLTLDYNEIESKLHLTIYFPSSLWKYDVDDKGVQCFSDAKGFVKVIDVNNVPFIETNDTFYSYYNQVNDTAVEKVVYVIDLVTKRSAQYWCEGHTKQFLLVATSKIVVNPKDNQLHVFALFLQTKIFNNEVDEATGIMDLTDKITATLNVDKVLIMEIFEVTSKDMLLLVHVHKGITEVHENEGNNIQATLDILKTTAETKLQEQNITFINLTSSLYCLPTTSISFDHAVLDWELTPIGHIAAPKQFCLQHNGLPVRRQCLGSYHSGGFWGDVEGKCDTKFEPSSTTTFLYNFFRGRFPENDTFRFLTDGLNYVLNDVDTIIPADIYYLAMSLQYVIDTVQENTTSVELGDIENMAWVMNRIQSFDNGYLRLAQTFNSTNVILDTINSIIEILALKGIQNKQVKRIFNQDFYHLAVEPQFVVQISYPEHTDVIGLAVVREPDSNDFLNMTIKPLYKNVTLDSVLSIENLELATWVPEEVLKTLRRVSNDTALNSTSSILFDVHIIISVFYDDAVFQQLDQSAHVINSRIIGISIPGYISNLEYPIPLIFKEISSSHARKSCSYWDFNKNAVGGSPGFWTDRDCFYVNTVSDLTVCECFHMTNFAQLIDIRGNTRPDTKSNEQHNKNLNIITLAGSFLSLLGIVGIWLTAIVFHTWRNKPGTKVLLQLSSAIALPIILMLVFDLDNTIFVKIDGQVMIPQDMRVFCIILGALLQYSVLSSFMWMLITAILQFVRYVRVLGVSRPSRFMIKFTLLGWGVPLIPVIVILIVKTDNYIPDLSNNFDRQICYPSGIYFILGILLPVCIILLINIVLFLLVIYAISRGPNGIMRASDKDLVKAQLRLSTLLFFLLGLTWIFGIFSFSKNLLWSYLFCLTSTLQGFVLFIYFVICDPATRNLWFTLMKPQFRLNTSRESITSLSSS